MIVFLRWGFLLLGHIHPINVVVSVDLVSLAVSLRVWVTFGDGICSSQDSKSLFLFIRRHAKNKKGAFKECGF